MIQRFSSRREPLKDFLAKQLENAHRYDRIAGFFSSSLLEVAGEALDRLPVAPGMSCVRVVCNSHLSPLDVQTAKAAKWGMRREWCASLPSDIGDGLKKRLQRLYDFLLSGRIKVKVLPDSSFGLIHGKAGVITRADGSKVSFLGSANESQTAWVNNYELVWLDESPDAVSWVQEEFDALWSSPQAVELADAVIEDIARLTKRVVIPDLGSWKKEEAKPESPAVELPVYRRENGLWAHQKYFIKVAFEDHKKGGARYLLADQVGLGKTIELALAAKLMGLYGSKPILILVPKSLMIQWQDELWNLLETPSARWNGRQWVDESNIAYPENGLMGLLKCPRRIGIISTGLIISGSDTADMLKELEYECVILDEAHRARRKNIGLTHRGESAEPNNLLRFMTEIAIKSKSLLLATATPVQLNPIEAWDLLCILNGGAKFVLGSRFSRWQTNPYDALDLVLGKLPPPKEMHEMWEWVRDPLPFASEGPDFMNLRRSLNLEPSDYWARPEAIQTLDGPDIQRVKNLSKSYFQKFHPFIRFIVRRTREFLETTIDPKTNEPYLQPIEIKLFGEGQKEALVLPPFLKDAYQAGEYFCSLLSQRQGLSSAFMKTILLRRVGSTIEAGRITAKKILGKTVEAGEPEEEWDDEPDESVSALYPLTSDESEALKRFLKILDENKDEDPKPREVLRILTEGVDKTGPWLSLGCIIFSQFYDSVQSLAQKLSTLLPEETIAIYANAAKSGLLENRRFRRMGRDEIRKLIEADRVRLVIGTDAASEGLNLQRLGSLVNLDLPWNPTRLEQRKGRIQRIGQIRKEVMIFNMRYKDSVEDRVHQMLSKRLENIRDMFGQLPDTLEDVWVATALSEEEKAKEIIDAVPLRHPFEMKYDRIESTDWESCSRVLDSLTQLETLRKGW